MGLADVPVPRCKEAPAEVALAREELVRRVASSTTFERSPRLRAFFLTTDLDFGAKAIERGTQRRLCRWSMWHDLGEFGPEKSGIGSGEEQSDA